MIQTFSRQVLCAMCSCLALALSLSLSLVLLVIAVSNGLLSSVCSYFDFPETLFEFSIKMLVRKSLQFRRAFELATFYINSKFLLREKEREGSSCV